MIISINMLIIAASPAEHAHCPVEAGAGRIFQVEGLSDSRLLGRLCFTRCDPILVRLRRYQDFCTDPKKSRTFALLLQFEIEAFCNLPPLAPLVDRKGFNRFLMNNFHVLMEIVIAA